MTLADKIADRRNQKKWDEEAAKRNTSAGRRALLRRAATSPELLTFDEVVEVDDALTDAQLSADELIGLLDREAYLLSRAATLVQARQAYNRIADTKLDGQYQAARAVADAYDAFHELIMLQSKYPEIINPVPAYPEVEAAQP